MIFNDTISIWNPFIKSLCSSTSAYYTGSKKKKFLPSWKVLLMSTVHNNFLDRLTITLPDRESVISIDKNIQNRLNSLRIIYYFNVCNWKSTLSTFKRINMYLCKSIVFNWISISSLFDYWNRSRKKIVIIIFVCCCPSEFIVQNMSTLSSMLQHWVFLTIQSIWLTYQFQVIDSQFTIFNFLDKPQL